MAQKFSVVMSIEEIRAKIVGRRIQVLRSGTMPIFSEPLEVLDVSGLSGNASGAGSNLICKVAFPNDRVYYVYFDDVIEVYED